MFSMNSRTRKEKKCETTLAGAVFLFHFFFHYCRAHRRRQQNISFSLSNDHYEKKKNRTDTFITPSDTAGKRPFLFYYYYVHFFFFIPHTPATIAIIQMPLLHFYSQCASVPAHYCLSDAILLRAVHYIISIYYYIFAKRERRKTLSLELVGSAFIRGSFCRLNITLYYFIRANPIKLFRFEILKVSRLAINIATHRCTRRTYNIFHTDYIYICVCII